MNIMTTQIPNDKLEKQPVIFGKYAALIVDILGQQSELANFKEDYDPYNDVDHHEVLGLLKNTSGKVLGIAKLMESLFDGFIGGRVYDYEKFINDSTFNYSLYKTNQRIGIQKQYFSDTLLFFTPLFGPNNMIYLGRIASLLLAAAGIQILSLAGKTPLRGAIDIGNAIHLPPIGLYGPLLSRIHHYESKIAGGPRIVIGDSCMKFLEYVKNLKVRNTYERILQAEAVNALLQICQDKDNCPMVDFLGPFMAHVSNEQPDLKLFEEVGKAYHFVNACKHQYQSEIATNGKEAEKLYMRYNMLQHYMRERKDKLWNNRGGRIKKS